MKRVFALIAGLATVVTQAEAEGPNRFHSGEFTLDGHEAWASFRYFPQGESNFSIAIIYPTYQPPIRVPLPAAPIIEYKDFKVALIDSDGTDARVRPMYHDQEFFGQTGNSGSTTNVGLFLVRLRPGKLPDKLRIVYKGIETTVRLQPEKR
jgi:hypothetical protein